MHELWIIPCHIGAFIYMKCLEWYGRQFFTYCSELFCIIVVLYLDRDSILSTQYKHLTRLLTWQYYEPQLWHLNNNGKDIFSNAKRWSNLFNSMYIINDEFSWTKTQQIFNKFSTLLQSATFVTNVCDVWQIHSRLNSSMNNPNK